MTQTDLLQHEVYLIDRIDKQVDVEMLLPSTRSSDLPPRLIARTAKLYLIFLASPSFGHVERALKLSSGSWPGTMLHRADRRMMGRDTEDTGYVSWCSYLHSRGPLADARCH
jgi:hypothetical protein